MLALLQADKYIDAKVFECTFCCATVDFSALSRLPQSPSDVTHFVKLKQGLENKYVHLRKAICPSGN